MKTKKTRKWIIIAAAVVLLAGTAAGVLYGTGAKSAVMKLLGIEIPRYVARTFGYYGQAIKTEPDLKNLKSVEENDGAAERYESNIPLLQSPAGFTAEIDAMITEELRNGQYTFDDPMVIQDAFQNSPLTALALFTTEEAQAVRVLVKGKTAAADITYTTPAQTEHRVPLIGLYPDAENTVELALLDGEGKETATGTLAVRTSGLPEKMKGMVEPVRMSGESAYGLTMVYGQNCKWPFAYDCNGDIRWFLDQETDFYGLYNLSEGRFIFQAPNSYTYSVGKLQSVRLYEMDYLGRTYKVYYLPYGSHHEVIEKTPGGNLLCLTSSMEAHYEDVIVELDRETGRTVNSLKLSDLFVNSTRLKMLDWAHINTVSWLPEDDTILISPRNVHSVMKIGWTDHKLKWILCDPSFWAGTPWEKYVLKPEEENTPWHYQQHTAYRILEDLDNNPETVEISLYDNHSQTFRKISTFTDTGVSAAMVYAVNEKAKTVRVIKKLDVIYSYICSDTVYDAESGHIFAMSANVEPDAFNGFQGMTYEFDYGTEEILNQFAIRETFYRATEMVPDVTPICEPIAPSDRTIVGTLMGLKKAGKVQLEPIGLLGDEVKLTRTGSTLFMEALNHYLSQVIFAGKEHTYFFDATGILFESLSYHDSIINAPVSLQDLEPDEYRVLGMYEDKLYSLSAGGQEAVITVKP